MLDDAAVLLRRAGHEAGHVHEGDDGDVEGVAKAHEARGLDAAFDVQAAGQHQRLVGDDADHVAVHAGKADDDVGRIVGLQLEELGIISRFDDEFFHVVRLVGVGRHERVQAHVGAAGRVLRGAVRRFFAVVGRNVVEQPAQHQQGFHIILKRQVGHAAFGGVGDGAAQLLRGYGFVRNGFDHFRPRHEHVGTVFDHEDEIGHGR